MGFSIVDLTEKDADLFDLYQDAAKAMSNFEVSARHPINFWLKMGFSLVGVMPDEEGLGKPGITFAKRVI